MNTMYLDCIPPNHAVEKIDLEKIKAEVYSDSCKSEIENQQTKDDDEISEVDVEYDVVPLWNSTKRKKLLKNWACLEKNSYLKSKWHSFLNNIPKQPLIIKIHLPNSQLEKAQPVRRKMLTGHFYGKDARQLNPIPYIRDPRKN